MQRPSSAGAQADTTTAVVASTAKSDTPREEVVKGLREAVSTDTRTVAHVDASSNQAKAAQLKAQEFRKQRLEVLQESVLQESVLRADELSELIQT